MLDGSRWNPLVKTVVLRHHERWNGSGYPDGLSGENIALLARVVAVADAFDAMTSDRPYRASLPLAVALHEIISKTGKQFDPFCADAFVQLQPRLEESLRQQKVLLQTQPEFSLPTVPLSSAQHRPCPGTREESRLLPSDVAAHILSLQ